MKMSAKTRAVDKVFKRRHRYEIPSWQRGKVWGRAKQQKLIDTMLRGWKIPKFTFIKSDNDAVEYEVADGQQRLNAIFEFMSGNLELSVESHGIFGAKKYSDLTADLSDAFDDFEIEYDEIEDETDEEIKQYFQRLQEGMALNGSEKLNAVDSKLRDFCQSLTSHKFFQETVAFRDTRYAFFEVIAKAAAVEVEGFGGGLRVDDLKLIFESQKNFSPESEVAKRLKKALDYLQKSLPVSAAMTRNRSTTQSLINLAAKLVEHSMSTSKHSQFGLYTEHFARELAEQIELGQDATDDDYIAYQRTVNANLKSGALARHRILLSKLLVFDPEFADDFSGVEISGANLELRIKEMSRDIREQIVDLNEAYSARVGNDLFRMTTKVIKTLNMAADPANSTARFTDLISGLYFIFRESVGKKLEKIPTSFADVNDMRIALQHDIDQEGPTAASKKKIKQASVFTKYIGVSIPSIADSTQLTIGHLKLLTNLRADLFIIIGKYS